MQESQFRLNSVQLRHGCLTLDADFSCTVLPHETVCVKIVFHCGAYSRRLPFPMTEMCRENERVCLKGTYTYRLHCLYYEMTCRENVIVSFEAQCGDSWQPLAVLPIAKPLPAGIQQTAHGLSIAPKFTRGIFRYQWRDYRDKRVLTTQLRKPLLALLNVFFALYCRFHPVSAARVTFLSGRRAQLGGNLAFVYEQLKKQPELDMQVFTFSDANGHKKWRIVWQFLKLYATSHVVIVDDYYRLLNMVKKPKGVKVLQLWHACGAFKTFGFTRLGKEGGPFQTTKNHRMYDYAFVSSQAVAKHYAEGFGLSDNAVIATGVPRTDVFFDAAYAQQARSAFFKKYPVLQGKKIILFAPTFRGNGQKSAYYPLEVFNINHFCETLGEDYAIVIKMHPFCQEQFSVDAAYRQRVIDLSDEAELNDLLFVTDILITDYSSVIFEAALLDIPMLFYAFDLEEYIASRDFYYPFEHFVPGAIVKTQAALESAILTQTFESEKIAPFRQRFFNATDGHATARVAQIVEKIVREEM